MIRQSLKLRYGVCDKGFKLLDLFIIHGSMGLQGIEFRIKDRID